MYLRISSAACLMAALTACGAGSPPPEGEKVDCAIGEAADFSSVCTLERVGEGIVVHHPDGSFRRFARDAASGTLIPQDGAEVLVPAADSFAIGPDRYRIPPALLAPSPPVQ
jgi:hypothetical protein